MTFKELQDECIRTRFKEGQRTSIRSWINLRYHVLWGLADWPWKRVGPADFAITAADTTPTMPSDFDRPLLMYDDQGEQVQWLEPDEFDATYLARELQGQSGKPSGFKWVAGTITIGPIPDSNYTYKLVYERGMSYLASGGAETTGSLTADNDQPIWDTQYHYVLVPGAIATGLRLENDPTYEQMEEEFQTIIQSMRDHYLPVVATYGNQQFGRDTGF